MAKLDSLLPGKADSKPFSSIPYQVPGIKTVLAQPSSMSCRATVYCMMRSWKDQMSYPIRDAVLKVGTKWADYYDKSFPRTKAAPIHGTGTSPIDDTTLCHFQDYLAYVRGDVVRPVPRSGAYQSALHIATMRELSLRLGPAAGAMIGYFSQHNSRLQY